MIETLLFLILAFWPPAIVAAFYVVQWARVALPVKKLALLNRILDGSLRRRLEGARIKLDPWGTWLHSDLLDDASMFRGVHEGSETRQMGVPMGTANLLASPVPGSSKHILILDIDHNARWVPSSTPGKGHLYVNVPMSFLQVKGILDAMVLAGVVHKNYKRHTLDRGYTNVRPPWVRKGKYYSERFSSDFYEEDGDTYERPAPTHLNQRKAMGL